MAGAFQSMQFSRVLWACRRGMLELDLLLGRYAREVYLELEESKQNQFDLLLKQEDQQLFDWFMGKKEPKVEFVNLIQEIQHYAQS